MGATSGGVAGLLFLWLSCVQLSFCERGILSSRCRTRCLDLFRPELIPENGVSGRRVYLSDCEKYTSCKSCLKPCSTNAKTVSSCSEVCQLSEIECNASCKFLKFADTVKLGRCPDIKDMQGFVMACLNTCTRDGECAGSEKCCGNGCGATCQIPIYSNTGLPPKPMNVTVQERKKGYAAKIKWDVHPGRSGRQNAVQYVVEASHSHGKYEIFEPEQWRVVATSQRKHTIVDDIMAVHVYRFRVAAVNSNGTKGFSIPSSEFVSSRDVRAPSPPRNLRKGETIIRGKANTVDLIIHWDSPERADIPVYKYNIFWSKQPNTITFSYQKLDWDKATVHGHELSYKLEGLQPGAWYFVQVEAVISHGRRRLRSDKTSAHMQTYNTHKGDQEHVRLHAPIYSDGIGVGNITIDDVYYQEGSTKASVHWDIAINKDNELEKFMLYWWPEDCDGVEPDSRMEATAIKPNFILYNLVYDCHYKVEVSAVNTEGLPGLPGIHTFYTPECSKIRSQGEFIPTCPVKEPSPPKKPPGVMYTITEGECNISMDVEWGVPISDSPILFYKLKWGRSTTPDSFARGTDIRYGTNMHTEVRVAKDKLSYTIRELNVGHHYSVEIWAVSDIGEGKRSYFHKNFPGIDTCDSRETERQKILKKPKPTRRLPADDVEYKTNIELKADNSAIVERISRIPDDPQKATDVHSTGVSVFRPIHRTHVLTLTFILTTLFVTKY